jgi:2-polyprenyl-6-methoxyphenol hydroxylase-like FAD-dependent oxidoreductase
MNQNKLKIVILGGGTAGWMTANLMAARWKDKEIQLTLIESPDVGIVGVGEGSTPSLQNFFQEIGVQDSEWMPECNATYKNGITFEGWTSIPGFETLSSFSIQNG